MVSAILGEMWILRLCSLTVRLKGKLIDGLFDWFLIVPLRRPIPAVGWLSLAGPKTNLSSTQGTDRTADLKLQAGRLNVVEGQGVWEKFKGI